MRKNIMRGLTTGTLIGMTAGMILASKMNYNNRRRVRKGGKIIKNAAEDLFDKIINNMQ